LIAEISNSSVTLSLTSTPPVSRAAFRVMPNSLRLMVVLPSKPIRWLPGSGAQAYSHAARPATGTWCTEACRRGEQSACACARRTSAGHQAQ